MSSDKPPSALSLSQPTNHSNGSSPRASLLNGSSNASALGKVKSDSRSNTPSGPQVLPAPQQSNQTYSAQQPNYSYGNENSGYMNSSGAPPYGALEYGNHQHHLSQSQPPTPQTATSGSSLSYAPGPPVLQPAYPQQHHSVFPQFPSFTNGVSSPAGQPGLSAHHSQQLLPLPQATQLAPSPASLGGISTGGPQTPVSATASGFNNHQFDTTGQIAPPGMKPRVAATLWEDEGSLCFQVEAKGVCVARREDNHMINGTKLLNVAGMTRGRRDGILKSEKVRHVVKIGPMHLKGVWIPFERALDFANKEKITELLYPLFVHNIGAFLYHPTNSNRTQAVMAAAAQRRRQDTEVLQQSQALGQGQMQRRNPTDIGTQPPPLHHPGMHNPLHTTLPPHSSLTQPVRPGIERSMSFPTPPSSASSVMGVGSSDGWSFSNGNMVPAVPGSGSQSLAIDTVMNSRSMPTTPATTPPGGPMQQLNQYPPPTSSVYQSNSSSMSQQNIAQQNMQRFSQPVPQSSQYMNQGREPSTMGPPPTSRGHAASLSRPSSRQNTSDDGHAKEDAEEQNGLVGEADDHVVQEVQHGDEEGDNEAEHDHDEEYTTHDGNYTNGHRSGVTVDGSSGATPRTTSSQQWNGYSTPPRGGSSNGTAVRQPPARNIYQQFSGENAQDHPESNGANAAESNYQSQSGLGVSMPSQTPPQPYGGLNGNSTPSSNKRLREMDDEEEHGSRPSSRGHDDRPGDSDGVNGIKRRKTMREGSVGGIGSSAFDRNVDGRLSRSRSTIVPRGRR